jgi:asparagine synthase (glutamine-hydrolysing)
LNGKAVASEQLKKMTDVMAYRGPDDEGVFSEAGVGLGHRRLSILDLSKAGHQPMATASNSSVIIPLGKWSGWAWDNSVTQTS